MEDAASLKESIHEDRARSLQVAEPGAMADWYVQHLGFRVVRGGDGPTAGRFMADSSGSVMLEVYYNPKMPLPDYASMDPALLHVAFLCDDVPGTVARLTAAGASLVGGPEILGEDELAMLRDPWAWLSSWSNAIGR